MKQILFFIAIAIATTSCNNRRMHMSVREGGTTIDGKTLWSVEVFHILDTTVVEFRVVCRVSPDSIKKVKAEEWENNKKLEAMYKRFEESSE